VVIPLLLCRCYKWRNTASAVEGSGKKSGQCPEMTGSYLGY
jgi:hypothetical protein